ncbi:MAG TPA: hypothetical protein VFZ66_05265 [Herpetosiphonaceae bacterium]
MKRKLFGAMLAAALVGSVVPTGSAEAAAYGTNFQVSITYQNVGSAPASVQFDFFAENSSSPVSFTPTTTLAPGASTSLAVGSVTGIGAGFKGSAVLSADQPVVATIVQFASGIATRPLSNGFSSADASAQQLVATVLKNQFNYSTYFSVQNVEAQPVDLTVKFYTPGSAAPVHTATAANLPANAAKYFDAGQIAALPSPFNGSAVVEAKLAGTSTPAKTVITVNELQTNGNGAKSFEGTSKSGAMVYMASALCKYTAAQYTHAYAVQNASSTDSVSFRVVYKRTGQPDIVDGPFTLAAGAKRSVLGCDKMPVNSIGSAVIERTGGTGTLVAVGKIDGGGVTSAFLGATTGAAKLALPYVRWSNDTNYNSGARQRSFIAIQNIGGADATNVRVQYINRDGTVVGTHNLGTIAPGAKKNSDAATAAALDLCGRFGEYGGGADCLGNAFGGGAIILADGGAQLTAVVRVQNGSGAPAGEDYNGIAVTTP